MSFRIHNTYTRALDVFEPLDTVTRTVKMYTCGPTVYAHAHIGNFRAYVFEDVLQRHLEYRGYKVERVMNLTDVDDKTIRASRAANMPLGEFTRPFKEAFFQDLTALRIKPATHYPAATEPRFIAKMVAMITLLIERGFAYQAEDRSVYYRISAFPKYGCLAHLNLDELRPSGRIRNDEYEKESVGDFALWKAWDAADGGVAWESPWGRGRPGWHIECSAMATEILGPRLDIHCGAEDNIFPHHEAEIAQSEACTKEQFVRYWVHCGYLVVDGQKMSKSLGNFFTVRDLLEKGFTGREVRFALLSNYRLPLNFTSESLPAARSSLARIDEWLLRLRGAAAAAKTASKYSLPSQGRYDEAMDNNLNISEALGHLFDAIRETNRALDQGQLLPEDARALLEWWERINSVLAIEPEKDEIPKDVEDFLAQREAARASRDWVSSDRLRAELERLGWLVKDTKDGQKLSRRL